MRGAPPTTQIPGGVDMGSSLFSHRYDRGELYKRYGGM